MSRQRKIALCVIGFFCLFHVLAVMGYLVRNGRLSIVPIYDDVTYLIDGLQRLEILERSGISGFLGSFRSLYAHSPFNSLTATFGFLLTGGAVWGAYLLNACWVFVLAALAVMALRTSDTRTQVGLVIAMLATPIFGSVVAEFRPDPVWGLLIGFSLALMASVDVTQLRASRLLGLGLLFGAAVLAKPTAAPATIVVLGVGLVIQVGLLLISHRRLTMKGVVRPLVLVGVGEILFIAPYAFTNGMQILAYIRTVMGADSSVWGAHVPLLERFTFYLTRDAGTSMLGWIWYWMVPVFVVCVGVLIRARNKRALSGLGAMAAAAFTAYAIVTASEMKTMMIGSILYGVIVAMTIWSLAQIFIHVRIRRNWILLAGLAIFSTQWLPTAGMIRRSDPAMIATQKASQATFPIVEQAIRVGSVKTVMITVPGPVYAGTLDFLTRQQGLPRAFIAAYTFNTWELFTASVAVSDVVVLSEAGMEGQALGFNFPSVQFQGRLLKELQTDPAFSGRPAYTDDKGRSVWVFARKAAR